MSQCDRILAILSDGDWHEKSQFYGFCVLHSRVSELRARGHVFEIEKRDGGRTVWYRLVAPLTESSELRSSGGSGNGRASTAPALVPLGSASAVPLGPAGADPLQLELIA